MKFSLLKGLSLVALMLLATRILLCLFIAITDVFVRRVVVLVFMFLGKCACSILNLG